MSFLKPLEAPELIDSPDIPEEELRRALELLAWLNLRFGGRGAILESLQRWAVDWPQGREAAILDVGTGLADIPVAIAAWARERGLRFKIVALEPSLASARMAREHAAAYPEIAVELGDLAWMAATGRRFDYVCASLLLHHIPPAGRAGALRALNALAVRGLIVSDLSRSLPSWLAVKAAVSLWGDRVTRYDGPLSVRRAFTPGELRGLAREAGIDYAAVRRRPFFRLTLEGLKGASGG